MQKPGTVILKPLQLKRTGGLYKAKSFKEKPDKNTAEKYITAGNYYWNSGIFVFKAGVFLDELRRYAPDIFENSQIAYNEAAIDGTIEGRKTIRIHLDNMNDIPSNGIDYAVMEKSNRVYVVSSNIGWTDLGSFDSIYNLPNKDANGNSLVDNLITVHAKNNLVFSDDRKIALVGIEDTIVIDTNDALLLIKKGCSQHVKDVVTRLQNGSDSDKDLTIVHSTVHRPWGTYIVLAESKNYKIKKIVVKPGKRLSLQKHLHRSEHWVVAMGSAIVQVGLEEQSVQKNESIYIPIGEMHRLTNIDEDDLVIIETQIGNYLGEDDIIRIKDDFNRIDQTDF